MIRRKPNENLQFKWKRLTVLKFKPKLDLKFLLTSKTIKIMKENKNRKGLRQVRAIFWLRCTLRVSYWHIKCKINWQRTFKRIHNWGIYRKYGFFLGFIKEPSEMVFKKLFRKILQYSQDMLESLLKNSNIGVFLLIMQNC